MARTKKSSVKPVEKREVSRKVINGAFIIFFDDGSIQIIAKPIDLTKEEVSSLFGSSEEEEEEEEELTGEQLNEMDFEELEDICEDKSLDTDPDDYDEDEVEKLRKAVAKELGINLPKKQEKKSKSKKGKK
jgi:hypothetical protein